MRTPITVELLGTYGGDLTHALSAWTSTSRDLPEEKRARIPAMLKQLAEAGHHTPFEKSTLHFLVTCDKATHIQLIKHRIGVSVNAESARYKELKDDRWYTPDDWPEHERELFDVAMVYAHENYHKLLERLVVAGVDRKRAKESARLILPHASMITQDVSFNFRSFMHFVGLRLDSHAQREVRIVAQEMMGLALSALDGDTHAFRHSLEAFGWDRARLTKEWLAVP
jgi:thymidylate synthase (FAD)